MKPPLVCGTQHSLRGKWEMIKLNTLSSPLSSSPTIFVADISPPAQGVDHRHVQKELGNVVVRLHNPVVLSPTAIQVTWTVRVAFFSSFLINLGVQRGFQSSPRPPFVLREGILFRVFLKTAALEYCNSRLKSEPTSNSCQVLSLTTVNFK